MTHQETRQSFRRKVTMHIFWANDVDHWGGWYEAMYPIPQVVYHHSLTLRTSGKLNLVLFRQKKKIQIDLFDMICAKLPFDYDVVHYLFNDDYNEGAKLVNFGPWSLNRSSLRTLLPGEWIAGEVIDCVAFYLWRENFYDEMKSNIWNFPAKFSNLALFDTVTDNTIDSAVFWEHDHFHARARTCEKINIPMNDDNSHWYLCTIDMEAKMILISNTKPRTDTGKSRVAERKEMAKKVVTRLERIIKLWGQKIGQIILFGKTVVPKQDDSNSCGLYVIIQMMFPEVTLRLLTEEESRVMRERLANLLYGCELNKAERGMNITYAIHSRGAQICFDPLDMTMQQTIKYILMSMEICPDYHEVPELQGLPLKGPDFIPIKSDDELKNFLRSYVDRGINVVDIKVELVKA